ncbi:MAG: hypothetical protein P8M78_15620 [Myxococcota bacterium]|nr:hypothetical protein [Myxococcota bacterium]
MAPHSLFSNGSLAGRSRRLGFRASAAGLGSMLVLLPALPSWPQSMSLDSVDVGQSRSLDDVEQATSGTPGGSRLAESESLDSVPAAHGESLDSVQSTLGTPLGDVAVAESSAPNNDHLIWQPTPCSEMSVPPFTTPQGANPSAWQSFLNAKQQQVRAADRSVQTATEAFGASLYRGEHLTATRVRLGEARDEARQHYSEVRCQMKDSLTVAERAGVLPGVLRPYQTE